MDPVCGTLSCGTCTAPETCGADGMCTACVPDCTGLQCGDDGCGGSCGTCTAPATCNASGQCVGGGDCTELVTDGGFEAGAGSGAWVETSTQFGTPLCDLATCNNSFPPHAGSVWAWFGGVSAGVEDGSLTQSVTIPAGAPATLFFFLWSFADGSGTAGYLDVTVDGTQVFHTTEADVANYAAWTLVQIDLSTYADGAAHSLAFVSNVQGAGISFLVDDISLGSGAECCIGECTVGDPNVCQGDSVFACVADAGGCGVLTLDTDCAANGQVCANGACVACVNGCDTENATQCNGDVVETCTLGGNGCLDWVAGTDCAATGDFCVSGACVTLTCTDLGSAVGVGVGTGDNTGLPNVLVPSCTFDESSGEVCFTWTPPADGTYILDTEGSTGTNDTILWVLDSTGAEVACDDDSGTGYLSALTYSFVTTETYTILVDTWAGSEGAFVLNIGAQICTPADTRCNADTVTLETCNALGSAWVGTTCPNGCEEDAGARCTMICADIGSTVAPNVANGDVSTLTATMTGTCGGGAVGPDTCFTFTAPAADNYIFDTVGSTYDTVLYVVDFLTGTSLGCNDDFTGTQSQVTIPLALGQQVNVVVDAYSATPTGTYVLNISLALPESICDDWTDNDSDGVFDCADPTSCQGTATCTPGAVASGQACSANNNCAATGGDPACLLETMGWPLGYCAEFCSLAANDCPAGSFCMDLGLGGDVGLCMDTCDPATDPSRADTYTDPDSGQVYSYVCRTDLGIGANICGPSWWGK